MINSSIMFFSICSQNFKTYFFSFYFLTFKGHELHSFFLTGLGIVRCDIPGLVSRVDKPLDFLGLYKTEHEASLRAHIPAKEISGEVIESHMLSAAKRYFHRSEVLDSVLAGFYHKVRTEEGQEDCQDIW